MPITFRTTNDDEWGAGKGANLTPEEIDFNIWTLRVLIQELEDNPPVARGISNIAVAGNTMTIYMTDATTLGPFTLPVASWNDRGVYQQDVTYEVNDVFHAPQFGLYRVNIEHTTDPDDPFEPGLMDGSQNVYQLIMAERTYRYEIGYFFPNKPGIDIEAGGNMAAHIAVENFYLPAGLASSVAKLFTAPDADLSFTIRKNTTDIGTLTFAAGNATGAFTFTTAIAFVPGDVFRLARPTALDADARELSVTFVGTYGAIPTP